MTDIQTSVCVVGGGPAGLLLGLLLAKRGVDVIVLEGHETFHREFRGEVLQPSTAHPAVGEVSSTYLIGRMMHRVLVENWEAEKAVEEAHKKVVEIYARHQEA